ncbi:baseplate wedge subunit [Luteitalea pratensis]|uniref:Baseplate wedge subunit n=1 Tax=Luteitalea pratensis TaxID=1855912 RepID=A0A143PIJ9_LUTPR|nr:putative baseplate assembly protein [Luteitalea pratensis]AMY08402.1 baseplate wedge subunit [Luteitalea pratensis]
MSEPNTATCGGCSPLPPNPPVGNPPGLTAIAYRSGTHATVLRRLLARLPIASVEPAPGDVRHPLAALTARTPDDPAIALLDAWACVADVLTFYQERIANEGFLRTAMERRSILELARLIGYELNPGVAASVHLAYSVDTSPGAPVEVSVAAGSRVQSVPGQNELPQTFETNADLLARADWNVLRPRLLHPQTLAINGGKLYLLAIGVGAGEGAATLDVAETHPLDLDTPLPSTGTVAGVEIETLYVDGTTTNLKAGDVVLLVGRHDEDSPPQTLTRTIRRVQEEDAQGRTRVDFDAAVPPRPTLVPIIRRRAIASIRRTVLDARSVTRAVVNQSWSDRDLTAWMSVQGWDPRAALDYIYTTVNNPRPKTRLGPGEPGAFAMRTRAGIFGHNAPAFRSLTAAAQSGFVDWDAGGGLPVWQDSRRDSNGAVVGYYREADFLLDRVVPGITGDGWVVLERPPRQYTPFRVATAGETSLAGFGLAGKATGLELARTDSGEGLANNDTDKSPAFTTRTTTAHVLSDQLALAQLPIDAPLGHGTTEATQLTLDRMVLRLREGQPIVVTGEREDLPGVTVSEVVTLEQVEHAGGFTTLYFSSPGLAFTYVRQTVTLNANVVLATHGERVAEVLGSGNAAQPGQHFYLRKSPLTYTSTASASGAANSLEVRVNRVRWAGKAHLLDEESDSESYQVRIADDGRAEVTFGDGTRGARLPTGVENVEATYRTGIGAAGMVGRDRLTLLLTRPLGVRGVTNPVGASGAADPETRDAARENAPQTVRAMGRIVSAPDAEHFANAFAGIGKARARTLWHAGTQWIHLTVAADAPAPGPASSGALPDHRVGASSALGRNLVEAIARSRDPGLRIRVDTYQPVFFNVSANVLIDDRHEWSDVDAAIRAVLQARFSFATRRFVDVVDLGHIVRVVQQVPGVVMVDVDTLHRFDQPPGLPARGRLVADDVIWPDGDAAPTALAQLLLINPLGIALTRVPAETMTS